MGVAVTVVMVLATLVTYPIYTYVMVPLDFEFLEIIFFIFIIASLVQMLEVIIRNVSAGSFAKRYGVEEGIPFDEPTIEFSYKNDDLGDPLINDYHALALKLATKEEIELIKKYAFKVNDVLKAYFLTLGVKLIDFKLEFGKTAEGQIVLADEISPDTCRFWDAKTNEKLDKDRFRRDMGGVEDAYKEIFKRVTGD